MSSLLIGSKLQNGKYTIQKVLGQGSFGITYLASTRMSLSGQLGNIAVNVNVTIKEFFMSSMNMRESNSGRVDRTDSTLVTEYKKKFIREANNLSHLQHENIVNVVEVFEENNTAYYVMEYLDGGTLDDMIVSKGRLSADETMKITSEVCSALQYMHDHRLLHLDLKPKNIMLTSGGGVKLIDFGLSKQYNENGEPESSTTLGLGTAGYAPVEQAAYRQDGSFPVTLDIYALGATMYKMLCGKTPPESSEILNNGLPLQPLRQAGVPEPMIAVVSKAMAVRRMDRYQTVAEMKSALLSSEKTSIATVVTPPPFAPDTETTHPKVTHTPPPVVTPNKHQAAPPVRQQYEPVYDEDDDSGNKKKYLILGLLALLLVAGVGLFFILSGQKDDREMIYNEENKEEIFNSVDTVDVFDDGASDAMKVAAKDAVEAAKDAAAIAERAAPVAEKSTPAVEKSSPVAERPTPVAERPAPVAPQPKPVQSSSDSSGKIFDVVEQQPTFPGGQGALLNWLSQNIHYPSVAEENGIQGRVVVKFVVETDGSISNVQVVRGVDPSLDKEAIRVVKAMPRWSPGRQNGQAVRVMYNVPVTFKLQ